MSFEQFDLNQHIHKAIKDAGYSSPTPIQEQAIPVALEGRDILASAQTGTGKTAAFMLPSLERISERSTVLNSRGPRVLVLTPTRELALQVTNSARVYGRYLNRLSVVSILGGVQYFKQRNQMKRPVDIMVATPGRLMDYMERGQIDFRRVEVFVLDEADRMLDIGFRDAVMKIASYLPEERQTLLFSATIDNSIKTLAADLLKDPVRVETVPQKTKHALIEQKLHYVHTPQLKQKLLSQLLTGKEITQAIIFTATKRNADQLAKRLKNEGLDAGALHGDMRQGARNKTISALRNGDLQFLVATDVAARGIDIRSVSHIINFDLPRQSEDYVHRIGRTGRSGSKGTAISIALPDESSTVRKIESYIGHQIETFTADGFTPVIVRSGSDRPFRRNNRTDRKRSFRRYPRTNRSHRHRGGSSDRMDRCSN